MDFERGRAVCVPAPTPPHKNLDTATVSQALPSDGATVLLNRYWGAVDPPTPAGLDGAFRGKGVGGPLPSRPPRPESYREDAEAAAGMCACGGSGGGGGGGGSGFESGGSGKSPPSAPGGAVEDAVNAALGDSGDGLTPLPAAAGDDGVAAAVAVGPDERGVGVGPEGVCHELAAAAESGWDFSSRWAGVSSRDATDERVAPMMTAMPVRMPPGGGGGDRESEKHGGWVFCVCESAATSVVPVDLNSFLHRAELNIARLHHALAGRASEATVSARSPPPPPPSPPPPPPPPPGAAEADREAGDAPPPLLSLDDIQRRYLSRERSGTTSSWSPSSSITKKKVDRQSESDADSATDTGTGTGADGGEASGSGGLELDEGSQPLSRKVVLFSAAAFARANAMEQTMWDGRLALWRDLFLPTGEGNEREQSSSVTPACFVPMWAGLPWPVLGGGDEGGTAPAAERLMRCVEALRQSGLVQPGGVCTSLEESGQQWDGRNAWPPMQWVLIQGLRRSADALETISSTTAATRAAQEKAVGRTPLAAAAARKLASELEEAFLSGALAGWEVTGGMMEKYDANDIGKGGGGGEYRLQVGFGWTNGVALDLLAGRPKR
ncbi:unnamed protein product [Pylaiella littoralis]